MAEEKKEFNLSDVVGGSLNILGLKLDLGQLLAAPEDLAERLEELREKLQAAGGKEVVSTEDWKRGGVSVSGYVRTRGFLGDNEYHLGTAAPPRPRERRASQAVEAVEPPVDVFDEGQRVTVVAEVPGITLDDLHLKVEGNVLSLSTGPGARRSYRKELSLEAEVEPGSLEATCRNGVLEVHLRKRSAGEGPASGGD